MNKYLSAILESANEDDYDAFNPDVYDSIKEELDLVQTPSSVVINQTGVNEYAIALEDLVAVTNYLAEADGNCTEVLALEKICEANNIETSSLSVVIPSQREFESFLEACCKEAKGCESSAGKEKAKKKARTFKERISRLKERGIKLKKKK